MCLCVISGWVGMCECVCVCMAGLGSGAWSMEGGVHPPHCSPVDAAKHHWDAGTLLVLGHVAGCFDHLWWSSVVWTASIYR